MGVVCGFGMLIIFASSGLGVGDSLTTVSGCRLHVITLMGFRRGARSGCVVHGGGLDMGIRHASSIDPDRARLSLEAIHLIRDEFS